jgi:predicted DCC family thiol-disulfide oxidoreductase YuxK
MNVSPEQSPADGTVPTPPNPDIEPAVILFDGVCNFCNGVVRWVFDRDPEGCFRFAPLQSAFAVRRLGELGRCVSLNTIVLIEGDRVYERSDAVLRITRRLRPPWSISAILLGVPRPLRDFVYRVVAAVRYRVWGRKDTCAIPPPGLRERFLDLA